MATSFTTVTTAGRSVPLFLIQADKTGTLTSPDARQALLAQIADGSFRDVYVFAHGWNNGFDQSLDLFTRFFTGFLERRPATPDWKPVFVGVQWPSIVLVFPWDKGPQIAGGDAEADARFQQQAVGEIGGELDDTGATRFAELAKRASLGAAEQEEIVRLARAAMAGTVPETALDTLPSEAELLASWQSLDRASKPAAPVTGDFGFAAEPRTPAAPGTGPQAAGLLSALDPRNLIRGATVYLMKDRAGTIGAKLVRPLLEQMTEAGAKVRLIGHSYGCRVVLAALSTGVLVHKARSALLLQPAVNQYCFAEAGRIPENAGGGGFRSALDQVKLPIYSTFSPHDFPLHGTFHLALRRAKDLGEAEIAAGAPPSIYCALGGYGPQGMADGSTATIPIVDHGAFDYPPSARVVALDGAGGRITAHGDVTNAFACWALAEQDSRPA
jgi:hypothetical protein